MQGIHQLRYIVFLLIMILCLQACNSQSADHKGSGSDPSTTGAAPLQWQSNMNDAYAQSVKANKPILAYFTSSDTCGLCKQMDAAVFSTPVFKTWAEKNVVLYKLDFSKDNQLPAGSVEQNIGMARYLKVSGYPVVWIIYITHEAENGRFKVKPLGYTGFQPTPEKLIGALQNFAHIPKDVNK